MSISYINLDKKVSEPKLSLCKPNLERTKIGNLTDVYNAELIINMGALNELTFNLPVEVERNNQLVKNPLIEKFNGLYHVRSEWNGVKEYFVYTKGNRRLSDSGREYQYRLLSLGHLLSKKIIRSYDEVSKSLTWFITDFLRETDWFVGYVDVEFDLIKRSYETTESTVLQAIFDIAEKFGALVEWDTVNQKINFVKPELTGKNKGFKIKEGVFLESLDAEINYDEVVTRLYVYGQDGLEFRRLSPTGMNYIESFDWFMHPFECDASYNVIKSSRYMSDELCVAIRKYEKKVADSTPLFKTYTTNKTNKEDEIQQREQELSVLQTQLNTILNERDVINATYMDDAPSRSDWQNVISRMNSKNAEIASKNAVIAGLKSQLQTINNQILSLSNSLSVDNNYTSTQLREMNKFIISKTYTNDTISDEQDLLDEGLKVFKQYNVPPTSLDISLVNFLKDFEFERIRDRIAIADTVTAKLQSLDLELSMKITQIKYNFETESLVLTVSNLKDLRDDWQQFLNKLYTASNTSTTVDMSKHLWDTVETTNDTVTKLINSAFDTAKNVLLGGYKNTVTITERGLYSKDIDDPNTFLVLNNALLAITKDGGNSVEVAINKDGVFANKLHGKILLSNKLWVEDDKGVVEIQSGLQKIYDQYGIPRVFLGRYPAFDNPSQFKYGLRIDDGHFEMRTSSSANRGVTIDSNGISTFNNNGVKTFDVNATTGKVSIIGSLDIRSSGASSRGTVIDDSGITMYGNSGQIMFRADHFGNIYYRGRLDNATGTVDNLGGSINNMDGTFRGDLVASGGTFTGTLQGVNGTFSGSLSAQTMQAISIRADQITSGTISSSLIDTQSLTSATIDVNQLRANNAAVTNLSSITSNLGNITGGTISIDTDMTIGNNLYIGTSFQYQNKAIIFGGSAGGARISYISDSIIIGAMNGVKFQGGTVDFSQVNVIGL